MGTMDVAKRPAATHPKSAAAAADGPNTLRELRRGDRPRNIIGLSLFEAPSLPEPRLPVLLPSGFPAMTVTTLLLVVAVDVDDELDGPELLVAVDRQAAGAERNQDVVCACLAGPVVDDRGHRHGAARGEDADVARCGGLRDR